MKTELKIGILSDTHGIFRPEWIPLLTSCDYLLHAGDVNSQNCYQKLKELGVPLYLVRGNCDMGDWATNIPEFLSFPIAGKIFYMVHNRSDLPFDLTEADFIIYGHTHHYEVLDRFGKIYINPGSAGSGDRFFGAKTMAILTLTQDSYEVTQQVL